LEEEMIKNKEEMYYVKRKIGYKKGKGLKKWMYKKGKI